MTTTGKHPDCNYYATTDDHGVVFCNKCGYVRTTEPPPFNPSGLAGLSNDELAEYSERMQGLYNQRQADIKSRLGALEVELSKSFGRLLIDKIQRDIDYLADLLSRS